MALLAQASVQLNEIALVPDSLLCMSVCQCSAVQPSTAAPARRGGEGRLAAGVSPQRVRAGIQERFDRRGVARGARRVQHRRPGLG